MWHNLDTRLRAALLIAAIALGTFWRLDGVSDAFFYGDEYHSLAAAQLPYSEIVRVFDDRGSHVPLPLLQRFFTGLFGTSVFSYRMVGIVPGILALLVFYPVARRLVGDAPARIATLAMAASPLLVFYSRFARSYSLVVLLGLLLVMLMPRVLSSGERVSRLALPAALIAGAIPWIHLCGIGLVGGIGLAALVRAWQIRRSPRGLGLPLAIFGGAALLTLVLYLPVLDPLRDYIGKVPEEEQARPLGVLGIADLLAGGRVAGMVLLAALPIAAILLFARKHPAALWLSGAAFGPVLTLAAMRPHGMEYAYARYLLPALPFMLMMVAWLLVEALRSNRRTAGAAEWPAVILGAALVAANFMTGPLSPRIHDDGPYSATYISMKELPAFDRPFPGTPAFYKTLAEQEAAVRIIVAPARAHRTLLLYRNYYMQHGKRTVLGRLGSEERILDGPYIDLDGIRPGEENGADYLILHMNVAWEANDYWKFVYEDAWPGHEVAGDGGFMTRHDRRNPPGLELKERTAVIAAEIRDRLGPPIFEDDYIRVWDIRPSARG
ncbi:MAG: hypothetical protein HKN20_04615 [Gemmatimonadetes bacterium]|nr:hypothetical protein [Gemmatimonadota bacterium]